MDELIRFGREYGVFFVIMLLAWLIQLQYRILARLQTNNAAVPAPQKPGALLDSVRGAGPSSGAQAAPATSAADTSDVEDNYDDPDFQLMPIPPGRTMRGKVEGVHGDAIHGNENRYMKDDYLGRVSHKADLELLDRRVYKNEFTLDIIKVKVITNEWEPEVGKVGWVSLDDTSFRADFDPERREILE